MQQKIDWKVAVARIPGPPKGQKATVKPTSSQAPELPQTILSLMQKHKLLT